jgi:hypothetical protein
MKISLLALASMAFSADAFSTINTQQTRSTIADK